MDDQAFGSVLVRLFSETPAYPDAPLFAVDVERRLNRGWALRRWLIFAAGGAGGVLAVAQSFGADVRDHFGDASKLLEAALDALNQLPIAPRMAALDLPLAGEALWLAIGLAVLAGALIAGRRLEGL